MKPPAPDFLHPARGRPPAPLLFALATLAVLAVAAGDAAEAWQARETAREALEAARTPPRRVARGEPAPPPVRALLGAPWGRRIAAVESAAAPGLDWLSMELAQDGELQLVGTGGRGAGALETAERLRASGAWASVVVSRIERAADGRERFEIRASTNEAAR